jgi:beta-lactamase regulating signal transducer with metallopeptidase domain
MPRNAITVAKERLRYLPMPDRSTHSFRHEALVWRTLVAMALAIAGAMAVRERTDPVPMTHQPAIPLTEGR